MAAKKGAAAKAAAAPEPKTITQTPSGIEIAYFLEPKRMYQLRRNSPGFVTDWAEVPSVTTVLKVLDKPALSWWGMRVGIKAVCQLIADGLLALDAEGRLLATIDATWEYATPENVELLVKQRKLTTNDTLSEAGDRGTWVHGAFEAWAALGQLPNPDEFPPEEHAYVVALRSFCEDMGDAWETGGVEIAVGSVQYGFAGRYDLRGKVTKDVTLASRVLTKDGKGTYVRPPKDSHIVIPAGTRLLVDAKTSKGIYGSHLLQLEAYEGAGVECGYEPTDMRAVLHLSQHGVYQFRQANASYDDWLAVLHTYTAMQRVEEAL